MKLADLTKRGGEWLKGVGPMHDVVISSRVRIARNLAGMPFLPRCSRQKQRELESRLRDELLSSGVAPEMFFVDVAAAGELDRQLLVERHLISRQHAEADHPRGVAISGSETIAIMVNEEDHLRIQLLRSGLQLEQAMAECNRIDDLLEERLGFAFHGRFGYLTACPTNVGTGLRISVMVHLPALKMSGEIEKVLRATRDMHLAVRGLYGEGTEAVGDFFQISNQTTLGKSEQEIVEDFCNRIIPKVIEYERRVRKALQDEQPEVLDDKIYRSVALLKSARIMSSEETMYLLSLVRLGINLGRVEDVSLRTVNQLYQEIQPAHLQKILGRELDSDQRAAARAQYIRKRLEAG